MNVLCCGRTILTGKFSFCCSAAFFFHSRSRSSLIRLSMEATSRLRLFKFSLCCCNLEFWSWLSLFLSWTPGRTRHKDKDKWWFNIFKTNIVCGATTCFGVAILFSKFYFCTPVAPCRGGLVQPQSSGCHGSCPFYHFWAIPTVGWAPPPWKQPSLVLSASAGTGCSSALSPPLERNEKEWEVKESIMK